MALGVAEYLRGRWRRAGWAAQEGLELALQTGERHNEAFALAVRALVRGSRGDETGCRADAAEAMRIAGERTIAVARIHALWALSVLELSLGRAEETVRLLRPHRERLIAAGVGEPGSVRFVQDEIEALVALGQTDEAEALLVWLQERGRALNRASALAAYARCRGLLALARRETRPRSPASRRRFAGTIASLCRSSAPGRSSRRGSRCATPGAGGTHAR